jgi:hypothetical protein
MVDTLPNVKLPKGGAWVDIYDELGIAVGTALVVQSLSTASVEFTIKATEPVATDGHELLPKGERVVVDAGSSGLWMSSLPGGSVHADPSIRDAIKVDPQLATTAYGNLTTSEETPIVQISGEYGLLDQVLTVIDAGASGTATVVDNKFTCQTGVAADGVAAILSFRLLSYRSGQGVVARLSGLFSPGVGNSRQLAGLITAENSFAFGFLNENFGIIYTHDGESEYRELTITTAAAGAEDADVTVDGVLYVVPITAGTEQHNAFEIANSLNAQVPNYDFSSNDDQVLAQAVLNGAGGAFAFASATAVAAWAQITVGVFPETEFTPQADWCEDNLSLWGTPVDPAHPVVLDPTKGNDYQIRFKYSGFGAIKFFLEDPSTGDPIHVHTIKYGNTATKPNVTNPSFRVGWVVRNLGNETNLTVAGSSASGFIEGKSAISNSPRAAAHDQLAIGADLTNVIAFRNRLNFGDKRNRAELLPLLLSLSTQANKSAFFEIIANPVFDGDVIFQYIEKAGSLMEVAIDKVGVSGGRLIGGKTVVAGSSEEIAFNIREFLKFAAQPGQVFSVASRVSGGAAADMQALATWVGDI